MTGQEYMSFLEQITNLNSANMTSFMLERDKMSKEEQLSKFKLLSHSADGFAEAAMAVGAYYNILRHQNEPLSPFNQEECDFLVMDILAKRIKPVFTDKTHPDYGVNRGWNDALYRSIEILKSMC